MVSGITPEQFQKNAWNTRKVAAALFPEEEWVLKETNIYVAKSRLSEEFDEINKWNKEIAQVRILTSRGNVAYFLPEQKTQAQMYADTVINGEVVELKTVSGNRSTLGSDFRQGYKQGAAIIRGRSDIQEHSVFIRLLSNLEVDSVRAKIAGELKVRTGKGHFICYFEIISKLFTWTFDELRAIIHK
ncbi:hypothetical protein AGMMS49546_38620 [Spirochaetia bacterium]|nr:hypothetical protein AGMMS49546_38620 [Spirochaetia bacterium]